MADLSLKQAPSVTRMSYGGGFPFSMISIVLFVVVVGAIGALFVLNGRMSAQKEELIKQNKIKEESLRPELIEQIITLEDRVKSIRTLISRHPYASNVYKIIEANTHPQVGFASFSFSSDTLKVEMTGETSSYRALARQITFFERDPQIEDVQFGGLSSSAPGVIGFRLTLTLRPAFLHIRQ
ncbi:MAG: hypothetical protein HYT41_01665 [Candidatus Sungbacteria bacterium]|nr:hypothetical protein [Candidatus Sungbacteria bacterium]